MYYLYTVFLKSYCQAILLFMYVQFRYVICDVISKIFTESGCKDNVCLLHQDLG